MTPLVTRLDLILDPSHRSSASQPETSSPRTLKHLMKPIYNFDRTYTNGISCEYTMPHEYGELEVHVTFGSKEKSDRSEIDEIVIKRPSNPTKTEANLIADTDFHEDMNENRDGGSRYMAPTWLHGYWLRRAKSWHTRSSSLLLVLLESNDFKAVLKHHMKWAIEHVQKNHRGRAVPPLPNDPNEKKQEMRSDNEGGESMRTAEESSNAPSTVRTAGTSSGNSGHPPDTTLDTTVSVPQQK